MSFRRIVFLIVLFAGVLTVSIEAKDNWLLVKTKNFNLVGNASEKDLRKVVIKLEQFRESLRIVFKTDQVTERPTTVVVFKNESSFKAYKPKRANGKIDDMIAGYFMSGEDMNYMTLSMEGEDERAFNIVFHEYVHFIVDAHTSRSAVPAWFSEGIAEYYSSFRIEDGHKVHFGLADSRHLYVLQQVGMMSFEKFFAIRNADLNETGDRSRGIFYSQSWAFVHFLIHTGKEAAMKKFLSLLAAKVETRQAFKDSFSMDYEKAQSELRQYISRGLFRYDLITLDKKLGIENDFVTAQLSDSDTNVYLGELLFRIDRADDAEPLMIKAVELDPRSTMALTSLGTLRFMQKKSIEAKAHLEKAISIDEENYLANFQYARLLSRENANQLELAMGYEPERAEKIRKHLRVAIRSEPEFTPSYELLAFVNLVNREFLDEALKNLMTAVRYHPRNQRYRLRLAEVLIAQKRFDDARKVAESISKNADSNAIKQQADDLLDRILENDKAKTVKAN